MSKSRAQDILDVGNKLFDDKSGLDSLCQEIAENCYPERADFTTKRTLGEDFGDHLMDSYPVLARRELGNFMSAILRPKNKPWFAATTQNDELDNDAEVGQFLEYLTNTTRTNFYDRRAKSIRATKEGDHDFVSFGQSIISVEEAPNREHLYYRGHHFRDCAWLENEIGEVDNLHRKDAMTARQMIAKFGANKVHEKIRTAAEKEPGKTFPIRVVVQPSDEYDYKGPGSKNAKGKRLPFNICYIDADHQSVIREGGLHDFIYVVSRWHTIPGFQYAFSPAAMTALPDMRLAQMLARIILEAGEKQIDPPLIAREEAVDGGTLQTGAINWIAAEYDERLGEALRTLKIDADMRIGFEMRKDVREMITRAWFLDKLSLPEPGTDRTAYEVARIIEDHVRNLLPLFEPMEVEYNSALLDKTFSCLMNMNKFDWSRDRPGALAGREITWTFKNPMQEASQRILVSQFGEVLQLIKAASEFGLQASPIKIQTALDDAIRGTSAPSLWRKTKAEIEAEEKQAAMRQRIAGAMQEVNAGADVAQKVGDAAQSLQMAGLSQPPQSTAKVQPPIGVGPAANINDARAAA